MAQDSVRWRSFPSKLINFLLYGSSGRSEQVAATDTNMMIN
jgi:hypothetical protein